MAAGLRRDAVGLVDAWHIPDFVLGSVLGVKDGDVYRKYFDAVATSRYQEMTREGQPFYWDSVIRPLLRDQ
jgi:acyl-CoA oxidase